MQTVKQKTRVLSVILMAMSALLIVLELLPYGIQIRWSFVTGEITPIDYSYFDLSLFLEHGIRAPLCTAVLSCVLLLLNALILVIRDEGFFILILIVNLLALIAAALSLSSAVIGAIVCVLLAVQLIVGLVGCSYIVRWKRGK